MRHRLLMGCAAMLTLALGLHTATPAARAADGPSTMATCTVYADPAYRSGSTVIGVHSIRCTAVVGYININATLSGGNGSYQYKSGSCSYKSECILYTSQPYAAGYWSTVTSGSTAVSSFTEKRTLVHLCC